jgi:hypothetical protein
MRGRFPNGVKALGENGQFKIIKKVNGFLTLAAFVVGTISVAVSLFVYTTAFY